MTMTTSELKVSNPLGLYDGCWVKLDNGNVFQINWDAGHMTEKWQGEKLQSYTETLRSLLPQGKEK